MREHSAQRSLVIPAWASADGPANDIVISTRARLARNIQGHPFPTHARDVDLKRVRDLVLDAIRDSTGISRKIGSFRVIHPSHLSEYQRQALVDSRLASRQHVLGGRYRPIVLNDTGTLSMMVNEEDHLRMQCILPGLQPLAALQMIQEFDGFIGSKIGYARTDNYGYLASSLANIGTGLRLSVMLHMAGMSFSGEAIPALTAATELKISVRGLLGEGTRAFGSIFQVSNETAIGFTEREITSRVKAAADHLVSREREVRRRIAAEQADDLRDAVEQARTSIMESSMLSGREAMAYLSMLRLGSDLDLGSKLSAKVFNELLMSMRLGTSAVVGKQTGCITDDVRRAKMVRERLVEVYQNCQLAFPE